MRKQHLALLILFSLLLFSNSAVASTNFINNDNANDVDIAILNGDTGLFVIAWCDDSDDSANYQVFYTNGTAYNTANVLDNDAQQLCRVSISALNETSFVISFLDGGFSNYDWSVVAFDIDDNVVVSEFDVNGDMGTDGMDVGICALNESRYASVGSDDTSFDADYTVYDLSTQILGSTTFDSSIAPSGIPSQNVDCSAIHSTSWVYAFYDNDANQFAFGILDDSGSVTTSRTTVDTTSGTSGVAVTGLADGNFAYVMCDESVDDVTFRVYDGSGSAVTSVIQVDSSISGCTGETGTKIEVAPLNTADGQFTIIFDDTVGDNVYIATYNSSGAEIQAPTKIDDSISSNHHVAIAGYNIVRDDSLCNQENTLVVAYNKLSGTDAVWETIFSDGTLWDGNCDSVPPIITIASPLNQTYPIDSIWANVTLDENGDWCGVSLNGGANQTLSGATTSWYKQLLSVPDGSNDVIFYCNDTAGNMGSTSQRFFTVDTIPLGITPTSPLNQTYYVNWIWANATTDESADWCGASIDNGANQTLSGATTSWFSNLTVTHGKHNITFYCNDTAGNMNQSINTQFTIYTIFPIIVNIDPIGVIPVIHFEYPQNFTYEINMSFENFTAYLWTNKTGSFEISATQTTPVVNGSNKIFWEIPFDPVIEWFVEVDDSALAVPNTTSTNNLTINFSQVPSNIAVTLTSPDGDTYTQYDDITFTYSINSVLFLGNATLYTDEDGTWSARANDSSPVNSSNQFIWNVTNASGTGTFNWNIYVCDEIGGCNFSSANKTFQTLWDTQGVMSDLIVINSGDTALIFLDYELRQDGTDVLSAFCEVSGDIVGFIFYNATSSQYENDYTAFGIGSKSYNIECTKAGYETQQGSDEFTIITEGLEVVQLQCDSSDFHFLSKTSLSDDTLYWVCNLDTDNPYKCYTQVYDTNQTGSKVIGALLQSYPKTRYLEQIAIDKFDSDGQIIKVHFGTDNVKPDTDYVYRVQCYNNETFGTFEELVRVEYNDLSEIGGFGVMIKDNAGYIIGFIVTAILLLWVFDLLYDHIRRTK